MCVETPLPSGVTGNGEKMMQDDVKVIAQASNPVAANADILGIGAAVLAGFLLLFASGFAQATVMHDTAHDQRHAMAFPCH